MLILNIEIIMTPSRIRPSDPPDFQRRRVRQINLYPTAAAAASYAALVPRFMILLA